MARIPPPRPPSGKFDPGRPVRNVAAVGPPAWAVTERPAGAVKLSLVIPTYNESRNLAELVGRLSAVLDTCLSGAYELLVVDDDSPDDTWALALQLADRFPALRVMRRRGEKGLSTAVIRGWQAARGEVLAVIDADLQHPAEVVERLWREIVRGADLERSVDVRRPGGKTGLRDGAAAPVREVQRDLRRKARSQRRSARIRASDSPPARERPRCAGRVLVGEELARPERRDRCRRRKRDEQRPD
ncbi:MAG: glycosyltransferase [Deltaproteobacteria bacterium]|nr:MAG: glycosyltransferase [Deltaproteobacteria bacterium]